ncbi:spxA [Acrasis kona]|uniref:SpxA n=1 Tax=Acrasis kona TaxID=1008807 RepID=A0AAW2ZBT2_9EUKA
MYHEDSKQYQTSPTKLAKVSINSNITNEEALIQYITAYFSKDESFERNKKKNLEFALSRVIKPTDIDMSQISLRQAIDLSCLAEDKGSRKPMIMNASNLRLKTNASKVVRELDINQNIAIESFLGTKTTPHYMVDKIKDRKKNKKTFPITIVADLTFQTKRELDLADRVQRHNRWNALIHNPDFEQTSLVLSDINALAAPHMHPNMFWNCALCGTKIYLLVDLEEFRSRFENKEFPHRNRLPWTENCTYRSTYQFNGRILFKEFKLLKNAFFRSHVISRS